MASVAGLGTAGTSLSTALYNILSAFRDAPKDIADLARGIDDLSLVLDHLITVLKEGKRIYRRNLLRSVDSVIRRIDDVHEEIWHLVDASSHSLTRVKWIFRRSKTSQMLVKIEAHKSTLQIMITSLLLAIEQRKHLGTKSNETLPETERPIRNKRRRLRRQAENLVQSAHRSLRELNEQREDEKEEALPSIEQRPTQNRQGYQTHGDTTARQTTGRNNTVQCQEPNTGGNELQSYRERRNDTALWLYRIVFSSENREKHAQQSSGPVANGSNALISRDNEAMKMVLGQRARSAQVVDDLLWDWTRLSEREIEETGEDDRPPRLESDSRQSPAREPHARLNPGQGDDGRRRPRSTSSSSRDMPSSLAEAAGSAYGANQYKKKKEDQSRSGSQRIHDSYPSRYPRDSSDTEDEARLKRRWKQEEDAEARGHREQEAQNSERRRMREEREAAEDARRSGRTEPTEDRDSRRYSGTRSPGFVPSSHTGGDEPPVTNTSYPTTRKHISLFQSPGDNTSRGRSASNPDRTDRPRPPRVVVDDYDSGSDSGERRTSSGSGHRPRSFNAEKDSPSRMQRAAMASLIAGAAEAFRLRNEPGGYSGEKGNRIVTAALAAGTIDATSENRSGERSKGRSPEK